MRFRTCLIALFALVSFAEAFNLECSSTREGRHWYLAGAVFSCTVENMKITKRGEVMQSASSTNIDQWKGILIKNQIVGYIPTFSKELGERLELIHIEDCHLKAIHREDLTQFPNLRYLDLYVNDLESLPGDLLESTPKLEYISFSKNKLKSVGKNIFKSLKYLKDALFDDAECIDSRARNPSDVETLKSLLLEKCKPEEEEMWAQIENLKQKNSEMPNQFVTRFEKKINELEMKIVEEQQKLQSCDQNLDAAAQTMRPLLAHNNFTSVDKAAVKIVCARYENENKTCRVIEFVIASSATKVIAVFDELGHVVQPSSLIIRHQSAFFLPNNLNEAFHHLEQLEVSSSGLFFVNSETFAGLDKLESLNLTSNKITSIKIGFFADLKLVTSLDLSSNRLESIETGAFEGLTSLKKLNLNDNKLRHITAHFLLKIMSLDSLELSKNSCVDKAYPGSSLEEIQAVIIKNCAEPSNFNCITNNDHHVCKAENFRVEHPKTYIGTVTGKNPENITKLIFEDQFVQFLPQKLSRTFSKLQELVVLRSQLSLLTKSDFMGLNDLTSLEICDNRLDSVEAETFDAVTQLIHLDLSSNHIQTLPPKIFERLTQLNSLRLSNNKLKVLNSDIFPVPNVIKIFRMDNNEIEEIDMKVLVFFKNADEIDLANNTCNNGKYQKTDERSEKTFAEFLVAILMKCVSA